MKKIFWLVLGLITTYQVYGLQLDADSHKALVSNLTDALCGREGALGELTSLVKKVSKDFDKNLIKSIQYCSNCTVQELFDLLDPRLFEQRDTVAHSLGISVLSKERWEKKELGRSVANLIQIYLSASGESNVELFVLVKHAYIQHTIYFDKRVFKEGYTREE